MSEPTADDESAELVVKARVLSPLGYAMIRFLGKPFITLDGMTEAGRWGENSFWLSLGDHDIDVAFHLFRVEQSGSDSLLHRSPSSKVK